MNVRLRTLTVFAAGLLVALALQAPAVQASVPRAARADGVPRFGNVFMIIGENTTYGQVTKNTSPYLVNQFKPGSAWFTTYFAVTHNSTANYVALTSGQYTRCEQVVLALKSGLVNPGMYSGLLNHYSALRMLQDGLGVSATYLANAATAAPINMVWK